MNKNSRLSTWSQLSEIYSVINKHVVDNSDHLNKALQELNSIVDLHTSSHFQFLVAQLEMLLTPPNKLRYTKYSLTFAAELLCVSPAAYRMLIERLTNCYTAKAANDQGLDESQCSKQ